MRIGVDLGGTKTEAAVMDRDGTLTRRLTCATPKGDYAATIAAITDLVASLEAETGATPARIGVGIPGTMSAQTGLVKNANSTCLIGKPFDRDLEAALGRPVRLANDADCFALSEAVDGAAAGRASVFGVILGTGVGGGLVIDGRLLSGPNRIAGEWGHNPLPWREDGDGPSHECYCGKAGCIETFLSGPGFAAHAGHPGTPAEDIVQNAESGDPAAQAHLERYIIQLAKALAHIINIVDPAAIVLGGGMSKIARLYSDVPRVWNRFVFSDSVVTELLPPRHGASSGVRGAAWLWNPDE